MTQSSPSPSDSLSRGGAQLIRDQVLQQGARHLPGEIVVAGPLPSQLLGALAVVVTLAGATFAALATYPQTETVTGWVAPESGLIRITARQGGTVDTLAASEGTAVATDDTIATIRSSARLLTGDAGPALASSLAEQALASAAAYKSQREKLRRDEAELRTRAMITREQLSEVRTRVAAVEQRAAIERGQVERAEGLAARGVIAPIVVDQRRAEALSVDQEAAAAREGALELERTLADTSAELAAVPAALADLDAQNRQHAAELDQRQITLQTGNLEVVTAPVAGTIATAPLHRGDYVSAGALVAVLTPRAARLGADLYLPTRAVGFVKVGQPVRIMYQAFPFERFGSARGVIAGISNATVLPTDNGLSALGIQEPVYRVRVRLARQSISAYGGAMPIRPGMLLSGEIVLGRRNLIQWLLDPIYAAKGAR